MTEPRRSRRPTKTSLFRVKVVTVVLAGAAFVGSLAGITLANPATGNRSFSVVQQTAALQPPALSDQTSNGPLVLPAFPQTLRIRPLARTRGS